MKADHSFAFYWSARGLVDVLVQTHVRMRCPRRVVARVRVAQHVVRRLERDEGVVGAFVVGGRRVGAGRVRVFIVRGVERRRARLLRRGQALRTVGVDSRSSSW